MSEQALSHHPVALVDILDRVLGQGVVVSGEIVVGVADVDLVRVSLRALLASIRSGTAGSMDQRGPVASAGGGPR
jgi:hypothetical protein